MELKVPMPPEPGKIIAEQVRERIAGDIGQGKTIEVQPEDERMETKQESVPKEELPDDGETPNPKRGRATSQDAK